MRERKWGRVECGGGGVDHHDARTFMPPHELRRVEKERRARCRSSSVSLLSARGLRQPQRSIVDGNFLALTNLGSAVELSSIVAGPAGSCAEYDLDHQIEGILGQIHIPFFSQLASPT